jgi:raffinose/stachyose/melibiose transport system permease protein
LLQSIKPKGGVIFAYLLIPLIVYIFAVFVPLFAAFQSSFQRREGPELLYTGFDNYITLLKDATFWHAFGNNIYLVVACIIGQIGFAFLIVLMINSRLVKFKGVHRTFGFFPATVAAVSIGFIWTMVYDYRRGLLNWILTVFGMEDQTKVWLNDPENIMLYVAIPLIWQWIGYYMVIILSAIAAIDSEIFEMAQIDGANAIQLAWHITLPLIKNTMLVCVTLCIAGNMKAFDHVFVMTKGGPGSASMVMAMWGWQNFAWNKLQYANTISIGIFVLSMIVILVSQSVVNNLTKEKGVG